MFESHLGNQKIREVGMKKSLLLLFYLEKYNKSLISSKRYGKIKNKQIFIFKIFILFFNFTQKFSQKCVKDFTCVSYNETIFINL